VIGALLLAVLSAGPTYTIDPNEAGGVRVRSGVAVVDNDGQDVEAALPAGVFLTVAGAEQIEGHVADLHLNVMRLEAQNKILVARTEELAAQPKPAVKWLAVAAGAGVVVGAGLAVAATLMLGPK